MFAWIGPSKCLVLSQWASNDSELCHPQELADAEAAASGKSKAAKKDAGGSKAKAAKPAQAPKDQKAANPKPADAKRKDLTVCMHLKGPIVMRRYAPILQRFLFL